MRPKRISVRVRSDAEPSAVYALLCDGATWPVWSSLGSFELLEPGAAGGLGALRLFRTGFVSSQEEVVELLPDRRFGYALRRGLPLRGYRADVDLTPDGSGTEIHWHSEFRPKIPGTGWFYRWFLGGFIARTAAGLAAHAASRPNRTPAP